MSAGLRGRVAVVTGAAHGIGNATACLLADAGATLVLDDIDVAGLAALRATLGSAVLATTHATDVRDAAAVQALARHAVEAWGRVDAVVNCAGVVVPGAIGTAPLDDVARQVDTNLGGTINVARAFLPTFHRQRSGHLVFLASLAGFVPLPGAAIYAATKFAVRGFSLSLAYELRGSGIHVTSLCPDATRTRMLDIEASDGDTTLSFANRLLEPMEVALSIVATLRRPRLEVTVPAARGRMIRQLGAMPFLFPVLYPLFDWMGRKRKGDYRRQMAGRRDGSWVMGAG